MTAEETTLDILEEAADTMDATLDVIESYDPPGIGGYILVGVLAAGISAGISYLVTKRVLETKYEKILATEIAEAKAFYSKLNKREDFDTPEKAAKQMKAVEALRQYQGSEDDEPLKEDEPEEEGEVNVYLQPQDMHPELAEENRTPDVPYIISEEEFLVGDREFDKTTITYYAGDGTLADERDKEIPLIDPIIGTRHLDLFGVGSNDSRIVYVRNERLSTDFEVLLHDSKYAHVVLGLEHSDGSPRDRRREREMKRYRGEDM